MIINNSQIYFEDNCVIHSTEINFLGKNETLWFKIHKKYSSWLTDKADPLLIALLIPAMKNSENIKIKGDISKKLYDNLDKIQDLLIKVIPYLSKIKIEANIVDELEKEFKEIISGFSAGIDAFTTFEDYYLNPKSNLKITNFLFNNLTLGKSRVAWKIENINKIKQKYNFSFFQTTSNLHAFYKKGHKIGFEQTHTMRNAAVAHFLGGNPNLFLYSSTFHKDLIQPIKSHDLAIIDDLLLPLLSSYTVECRSVGSEYTRLEKTIKVSEMIDAYDHLDTCIGKQKSPYINCGQCRKCTRALLTFELVGNKEKFHKVFNLKNWNAVKSQYLNELPKREQLNDKELYNYIKNKEG